MNTECIIHVEKYTSGKIRITEIDGTTILFEPSLRDRQKLFDTLPLLLRIGVPYPVKLPASQRWESDHLVITMEEDGVIYDIKIDECVRSVCVSWVE
jgi:hypothetical protein